MELGDKATKMLIGLMEGLELEDQLDLYATLDRVYDCHERRREEIYSQAPDDMQEQHYKGNRDQIIICMARLYVDGDL